MMFTQEDTNIDIDLKLNINLRPGNVKDLTSMFPVEELFQDWLFPTKKK